MPVSASPEGSRPPALLHQRLPRGSVPVSLCGFITSVSGWSLCRPLSKWHGVPSLQAELGPPDLTPACLSSLVIPARAYPKCLRVPAWDRPSSVRIFLYKMHRLRCFRKPAPHTGITVPVVPAPASLTAVVLTACLSLSMLEGLPEVIMTRCRHTCRLVRERGGDFRDSWTWHSGKALCQARVPSRRRDT